MTSGDRATMTGMRPADMQAKFKVPGFPQDMMEMHGMITPAEFKKVNTQLTRGMRRNWPMGTQAMMTVLRVLPDELYERVVNGNEPIEPGASSPGTGPGVDMSQMQMDQMHQMDQMDHSGHSMPSQDAVPPGQSMPGHEEHSPPGDGTAPARPKRDAAEHRHEE